MINGKKVLAIIPARGGSKGLPGKNIKMVSGKPLIAWSIEHGLNCPEVDTTIVSTDDSEIARVAKEFGAEVPFLRPDFLANDTASSIDVILHAIDFLKDQDQHFDIIVLLEPTSPLREVSDISGALKKLVQTPTLGSVVGVSQAESVHPAFLYKEQEGMLKPYLDKQPNNLRRQDLEELYYLEGTVYVSLIDVLRSKKGFYHEQTAGWVVPRYKSFEVDELVDLICVEALMTARQQGKI